MNPKKTDTMTACHHPDGGRARRLVRLLGHVRRGVVARDRVLRHRESDPKTNQNVMLLQPVPEKPELLIVSLNTYATDSVLVRHDDQSGDDDDDADHVPVRGDRVQPAVIRTSNRLNSVATSITTLKNRKMYSRVFG